MQGSARPILSACTTRGRKGLAKVTFGMQLIKNTEGMVNSNHLRRYTVLNSMNDDLDVVLASRKGRVDMAR